MYIDVNNICRYLRESLMDEFAFDIADLEYTGDYKLKAESKQICFTSELKFDDEKDKDVYDDDYDEELDEELDEEQLVERTNKIMLYFDHLKYCSYDMYKQVISMLFVDYYVMAYYYIKQCDEDYDLSLFDDFKSVDDIIYFIDENPEFLVTIMSESLEFCLADHEEKRDIIINCKKKETYLMKINPLFILDKIEYCRKQTKEDIIIKQREYYKEYSATDIIKDKTNAELEQMSEDNTDLSIWDAAYYLRNIYHIDKRNYRSLILDIAKDTYKYLLYKKTYEQEKDSYLINLFEQMSLSNFIRETLEDKTKLDDLLSSFIELNKLNLDKKKEIMAKVEQNENKILIKKILR